MHSVTACNHVSIHLFLRTFWDIALKNDEWKCQDVHKKNLIEDTFF